MRHPITCSTIGLFCSLLFAPTALAQNCNDAQSQAEINQCAYQEYSREDAELNRVWKEIQRSFTRDRWNQKRKAALLASQRAWLAYRDKDCEGAVGTEWEGGSGRPMAVGFCLTALTKTRTERLRERYLSGR